MSEASAADAAMDMTGVPPSAGQAPPIAGQPAAAGMWQPSQSQKFDPRRKSPVLAAVLSVMPVNMNTLLLYVQWRPWIL